MAARHNRYSPALIEGRPAACYRRPKTPVGRRLALPMLGGRSQSSRRSGAGANARFFLRPHAPFFERTQIWQIVRRRIAVNEPLK
jgi:hypothetical protein